MGLVPDWGLGCGGGGGTSDWPLDCGGGGGGGTPDSGGGGILDWPFDCGEIPDWP